VTSLLDGVATTSRAGTRDVPHRWADRAAGDSDGHVVGWGHLGVDPNPRAFLLTLGAGCGNGLLGSGEGCDDGGTDAGDGCSATCVAEAPWQCDGQPSLCRLSDRPLDALKLVLKRKTYGSLEREKVAFISKDPSALVPAPGGMDDPTVVGAKVDLFSDTEGSATFDLPASNWQTGAGGAGYAFVNRTAPDAVSAVKAATLRQGRIKVVAKAIGLPLVGLQLGVGVRVRVGSQWNCARFGSVTVVHDTPSKAFTARGALASAVSDCSENSLH
jgi:cysteine-rich repeat protein